jgi:signal transduction histidine kinase
MKPKTNGVSAPHRLLVISDASGFSRDLIARWQMQPQVPEFTALSSDLLPASTASQFELSIAGDVQPERCAEILACLNRGRTPGVYVAVAGQSVHMLRRDYPRVVVVPRHDAWLDTLVLLAEEMLRRTEISAHIERLEQNARTNQTNSVLGRYMVEARHGFNNALTSVLGNAELLLLQSTVLSPQMREQLETLHAMTLRMHEMMQRFTSLESEMHCAEKLVQSEKAPDSLSYAAGI